MVKFTGLAKFAGTVLKEVLAQWLIWSDWERWLIGVSSFHTTQRMVVFARISILAPSCAEEVSANGLAESLWVMGHLVFSFSGGNEVAASFFRILNEKKN
jgi:hypothetical protein